MAGDAHLWKEFAKFEDLYTVETVIGVFRIHSGQKSRNIDAYYSEANFPYVNKIVRKLLRKMDVEWQKKRKNLISLIDIGEILKVSSDENTLAM